MAIVGLFWPNDTLQFLIALAGVFIFTSLAAWDAQRLKQMALEVPSDRVGLGNERKIESMMHLNFGISTSGTE